MTSTAPLAARMRPTSLDDIIGQEHLLQPGSQLRRIAESGARTSVFLWGPPGVGKTTMAQAIAATTNQRFVEISATSAGVKDVRAALAAADKALSDDGVSTILFIDEVHRFSKAQQDVLLPAVEEGTVTLIAATTENPSFSVIAPLLSRANLLTLRPLDDDHVFELLQRTIAHPDGLNHAIQLEDQAAHALVDLSGGDARRALTYLEEVAAAAQAQDLTTVTVEMVGQSIDRAVARYDKDGDQHYDVISAFIKSMRGSDPDATIYWLARMIEAGEDPRFIARRIVVHASEDVGSADPTVLPIAIAAAHAVQLIGLPEARLNLAQAAVAVATAPKSAAVHDAINDAIADVQAGKTGEVPVHLRDSHYKGAAQHGHGVGYRYPHHYPHGVVEQNYMPEGMENTKYVDFTTNGFDATIVKRLQAIEAMTRHQ